MSALPAIERRCGSDSAYIPTGERAMGRTFARFFVSGAYSLEAQERRDSSHVQTLGLGPALCSHNSLQRCRGSLGLIVIGLRLLFG